MKGRVMLFVACLIAGTLHAAPTSDVFYIYSEKGAPSNHFVPSGWMGDYGDLKVEDGFATDPQAGKTSIKWTYTAQGKQGAGWAGCFWQNPGNNWGEKAGGYDLSAYKRLTFFARGAKGDERIATFKVGGISGEHGDSDSTEVGPVVLTKQWKKYTINLDGKTLTNIIGGFAWAASRDDNPDGFVIYLDEIRFEK